MEETGAFAIYTHTNRSEPVHKACDPSQERLRMKTAHLPWNNLSDEPGETGQQGQVKAIFSPISG